MKAPLFPEWTAIIGFILGTFVGSFLNMLIYRLPRDLSFNEPKRSFCPTCKQALGWIDLAPLLSWLSTGGKCRYCKKPIAVRYFLVEMLTGFLFAGIWWRFMAGMPNPLLNPAACYAICASVLVAIIFIDWEFYIIPDELNAVLLAVGLIFSAIAGQFMAGVYGALLGWGLLWGIALFGRIGFGKDAMGDGDIKMMRGVGALIGPLLLLANMGIAVVLGLIGGIAGIAIVKIKASKVQTDPSNQQEHNKTEEDLPPSPVWVVALSGVWYLLCLDVVCLFVKPLDKWIMSKLPAENLKEDDEWKPTPTTIPFGPYLAAGALVCMLFGAQIEDSMRAYWRGATNGGSASAGAYRLDKAHDVLGVIGSEAVKATQQGGNGADKGVF